MGRMRWVYDLHLLKNGFSQFDGAYIESFCKKEKVQTHCLGFIEGADSLLNVLWRHHTGFRGRPRKPMDVQAIQARITGAV